MHTYTYIHTNICMCIYTSLIELYSNIRIDTCIPSFHPMYSNISIDTCIFMYIYAYSHIYTHTFIRIYNVYTYINIYKYT
jgi:hypothetical protein